MRPGRQKGFRAKEVWVLLAVTDDIEGIVVFQGLPVTMLDIEILTPDAKKSIAATAKHFNRKIELVRFTTREVVETFNP
jgi:hypothetical protein